MLKLFIWNGGIKLELTDKKKFIYRSNKYRKIINEKELKKTCIEYLEVHSIAFNPEDFNDIGTITGWARYMCEEKHISISEFNNIVFSNMTFTCSNIFLDKITNSISDKEIENFFEFIINNINKDLVGIDQFELMNKSGFNLLDFAVTTKSNKLFFPLLEYDADTIKILCIVQYETKKDREHRMGSIIINRSNNDVSFYINGTLGSFELSNYNKETVSGAKGFFDVLKKFLNSYLKVTFIQRNLYYQIEREKIFLFCKKLNQCMIEDYSKDLEDGIGSTLTGQITRTFNQLRKMNNSIQVDRKTKNNVYNKIFDTYLGQYITKGYTEDDLKNKAIEKGMYCYPTKISFTGQQLSKGKAKTRGKKIPLVFEDVFYSLNTDIDNAKKLEEVTIAWFDQNFFGGKDEKNVSQTTITVNKKYLLITMNNSANKNKGMTMYVEQAIRKILN